MEIVLIDQNQTDARYEMNRNGICQTVTARWGTGGGHVPMVILIDNDRRHCSYRVIEEEIAPTVVAKYGTGGGNTPLVLASSDALGDQNKSFDVESIGHDIRATQFARNGCCDTMAATDYKEPIVVCYEKTNSDTENRIRDGIIRMDSDLRDGIKPV